MTNASSRAARPRIGFIGLGIMGTPMSGHLLRAGYRMTVFDRDPAAARRVAETHEGAVAAMSPRAVAAASDIVITMLPNGQVVREVATGVDGLIEGFESGALLLDTSSAEPWITRDTARALVARGVGMVDAPVSGAQWGAEAAELVFMVGGEAEAVARVRPLLDVLGRAVFHLGPLGSGHVMKCLNNTVTAMTFIATCEMLIAGAREGLDPAVMNQVFNESTGQSWITRNHIDQRIISRSFDDPFKLELMLKDISIAMDLARQRGLPLPMSALGQHLYRAASVQAGAGSSLSELARFIERLAGTEILPGGRP